MQFLRNQRPHVAKGVVALITHAVYGGHRISVTIRDGRATGRFPPRAQALALEWLGLHRAELLEDWELARAGKPLEPIAALE